jgi:hypothetical protein
MARDAGDAWMGEDARAWVAGVVVDADRCVERTNPALLALCWRILREMATRRDRPVTCSGWDVIDVT